MLRTVLQTTSVNLRALAEYSPARQFWWTTFKVGAWRVRDFFFLAAVDNVRNRDRINLPKKGYAKVKRFVLLGNLRSSLLLRFVGRSLFALMHTVGSSQFVSVVTNGRNGLL